MKTRTFYSNLHGAEPSQCRTEPAPNQVGAEPDSAEQGWRRTGIAESVGAEPAAPNSTALHAVACPV